MVAHTDDISWDNPLAAIWSNVEMNVGIVCSCLPTLKGLVQRFFPRLFPTVHTGWSSNRYDMGSSGRSTSKRYRVSHSAIDHELTGREKYSSKAHVGVGWEDEGTGRFNTTPQTNLPDEGHIAVHTVVRQDVKRDSEVASLESESERRLVPGRSSFLMV